MRPIENMATSVALVPLEFDLSDVRFCFTLFHFVNIFRDMGQGSQYCWPFTLTHLGAAPTVYTMSDGAAVGSPHGLSPSGLPVS